MAAVNSVASSRLPLPSFSPRAVLMYSAAVGGEGAVALQLREARPGERGAAPRFNEERLAIACSEPELLADLLHAAADIGGEQDGLSSLLGGRSPDAAASDLSDGLSTPDHDHDCLSSSSFLSGLATVSVAVAGLERPAARKPRPKPASPNRQGPQQCQVCNKIFGNASALAKHKLTHSDERKYVCSMCSKAFKRQDHLNGHMLTHRNKKPYECKAEGCGKSYCDARSLRRHTENHHQPANKTLIGMHTRTHTQECKAEGCGKSYCDARSLRRHTENHHQPAASKTLIESAACSSSSGSSSSSSSGERRAPSPPSPGRCRPPHSESSSSSDKSSGDSSPPATPPTPPARPRPPLKPPLMKTKTFMTTFDSPSAAGFKSKPRLMGWRHRPGPGPGDHQVPIYLIINCAFVTR
ncbi:hypothetical protein JYU34_018625 [Plutella xylostella]|uniref:C2H2-type domain-containing protein n=1 Tax=Plutella xylostella TaxID=51655 RepID=A0ABQ7PYB0_PLUXY|nr:hypothetical protein JYU34_018625 [Plutella xylostella]